MSEEGRAGIANADEGSIGGHAVIGAPAWARVISANEPPPPRTGHIMVSYKDMLYM